MVAQVVTRLALACLVLTGCGRIWFEEHIDASTGTPGDGSGDDGGTPGVWVPAPQGCNLDGDGLPPTTCSGPDPAAFSFVACLCMSPPCSPGCTTSSSTFATALASIGAPSGPALLSIEAGTYATTSLAIGTATSQTAPLVVAARCNGGVRDPVRIDDLMVAVSYVTLEGLAMKAVTATGADHVVLRDLVAEGLTADGTDGLVDDVDMGPNQSSLFDVTNWTIRRTSTCGTGGWFVRGMNVHFDRVLVENNDRACIEAIPLASPGLIVENSILRGCLDEGVRVSGLGAIVRNNQIHNCSVGIEAAYVDAGDITIWNNLLYGNTGVDIELGPPSGTGATIEWNTLLSPNGITIGNCSNALSIASFTGNLVRGENICNSIMVEGAFNVHAMAGNCTCNTSYPGCASASSCLEGPPVFYDPMFDASYHLDPASMAVDAVSFMDASTVCSGGFCLDHGSTQADNALDTGPVDLGYHERILP